MPNIKVQQKKIKKMMNQITLGANCRLFKIIMSTTPRKWVVDKVWTVFGGESPDGRRIDPDYEESEGHYEPATATLVAEEFDLAPILEEIKNRERELFKITELNPELSFSVGNIFVDAKTKPSYFKKDKSFDTGDEVVPCSYEHRYLVAVRRTPKGQCVEGIRPYFWGNEISERKKIKYPINISLTGFRELDSYPDDNVWLNESAYLVEDILIEEGVLDERFAL